MEEAWNNEKKLMYQPLNGLSYGNTNQAITQTEPRGEHSNSSRMVS